MGLYAMTGLDGTGLLLLLRALQTPSTSLCAPWLLPCALWARWTRRAPRTEPGLATSYVDAGKVGVDLTDLAHVNAEHPDTDQATSYVDAGKVGN